jgi:hypothetical protein
MSVALVTAPDATIPLELTIEQEGVGGVTGQLPSVRIRDASTTNSFLDWNDNTFKTVGWTELDHLLNEVGDGHYTEVLSLSAINAVVGNIFVAQYTLNGGGFLVGDAHDVILVGQQALAAMAQAVADVSLIRKSVTNRMEEFPGTPGTLILWDDDGTTPLIQWTLRDAAGGGVVATVGCPAKRSAAT